MKTKYTILIIFISIFSFIVKAGTYDITETDNISWTTEYVNNCNETWNITSSVTDKPIIITYSIGTENNYDYLTINNVDNSGNVTSQLLRISGTKSGIVSTTIPNGRAQVVFTSDVSVCYASNPSVYSGINVTFSVNPNQIVGNGLFVNGDSYISGNVGIGKNPPQAQLDVTGGVGGLAITGTNLDPYYSNKLLPFQNSAKLILGWNYSGSRGEQDFIANSNPTLAGGFSFYNYPYNGSSATHLMTIEASGKVGVGTSTPSSILQIKKSDASINPNLSNTAALDIWNSSGGSNTGGQINFRSDANTGPAGIGAVISYLNKSSNASGSAGDLVFGVKSTSLTETSVIPAMTIQYGGNVKIGSSATSPSEELLTVFGVIHAKEVRVDLTGSLADYVFKSTYKLMPLNQVEQFVKTNSHLPEIPSAAEIIKKGMSVGEMQNKLLQKIEELTLYVIEQQKQIEELKQQLKK